MAVQPQPEPESPRPALLIDASIYIFQYYFSMPDHWVSEEGNPTGAVYGYTTFLLRLLQQHGPGRIAACFDESLGSCFRNELYPAYKVSRPPADILLKFQIAACREVTGLLGITHLASDRYEADDLIGTLYRRLQRNPAPVAILTRDKDLGQLIRREQDFLWDYSKDQRHYADHLEARFGVRPQQLVDYLALVGDSVDDIPGVPGLGPKTASALLQHYGSIDQLFQQLDRVAELPVRGARTLAAKLEAHREQIMMARELTRIAQNVALECSVRELEWRPSRPSREAIEAFCERMGFPRLSRRFADVLGWR